MRIQPVGDGANQAATRRYQYMPDNHGRKFGAWIDNVSNDPCGPIEPSFVSPLHPNPKYMLLVRDEWNHPAIRHDYQNWIADFQQMDMEYMREANRQMSERHQLKYTSDMEIDDDIKFRMGRRPSIQANIIGGTVQPLVAAKAGNKWVLGLTDVVDERVSKYFIVEQDAAQGIDYAADPSFDEQYDKDNMGGKTVPTEKNLRERGSMKNKLHDLQAGA